MISIISVLNSILIILSTLRKLKNVGQINLPLIFTNLNYSYSYAINFRDQCSKKSLNLEYLIIRYALLSV